MSDETSKPSPSGAALTRRHFLSTTGAAIAAVAASAPFANAQQQQGIPPADMVARPPGKQILSPDHHLPNEKQPGPTNPPIEAENPNTVWPPPTDNGSVETFKFSFADSHKEIDSGGWTRQVTVRDLPVSKTMAGVEMYLTPGSIRELHWHVSAEWAFVIHGKARITAVEPMTGKSFVNDVSAGDLWLFPGGTPHSIQGLGPDGCMFLLVFNQGNFNEFDTFLLSDWFEHTPKEVLAKNFNVPESTFDHVPRQKLYIFQSDLPRPLAEEQQQAAQGTGEIDEKFVFRPQQMQPTKQTSGGNVKIIDNKNFPATNISAAIVTLKPGGLREMHWHPLSDEWQYYVSGKGRMTIFNAAQAARTEDFQAGDVGYIEISKPHFIENTGDEDLVFLEVFPNPVYQDMSAALWLAHIPTRLANEHLHTGEDFLKNISKQEAIIVPL
jgi:oxalate decarboxylase